MLDSEDKNWFRNLELCDWTKKSIQGKKYIDELKKLFPKRKVELGVFFYLCELSLSGTIAERNKGSGCNL